MPMIEPQNWLRPPRAKGHGKECAEGRRSGGPTAVPLPVQTPQDAGSDVMTRPYACAFGTGADRQVDVLVLLESVSLVQTPLLQLCEVEPDESSLLSSVDVSSLDDDDDDDVDVDVDVLVVHWSLPLSSATQVLVSVVQTSLLQLVDVEVDVVPGSLAAAGAARPPPRISSKNVPTAVTLILNSLRVLMA